MYEEWSWSRAQAEEDTRKKQLNDVVQITKLP